MKCLVVDQSATRRRILRNVVGSRAGHLFLEASTVAEALRHADEGADLVLTDWHLGQDGTGLDLLREVRARIGAALPVIMVTSRNVRNDVMAAVDAGVTAYVVRPFTADALRTRILPHLPAE